jgi:phage terminase large subunit-like protein
MPPKKQKVASSTPAKSKVTAAWRKLLSLIPGYDPFVTAGDAWFDPVLGQKVLDFFGECLRHVEGALAGQPFKLEPWEQAILANLFGWQRIDRLGRQVRRYRETLIYIPRKNGKTPLAAGICNYCLFCDNEPGAQIYSAAAEKEQAALLFRHAKGMIEQEPELDARAIIYRALKSVALKGDPASTYKVLSAEANTKHGGNSHLVLIDELHAQPNRDLVDVLLTSMASANRRQPLIVYITTADFARPSICNEKHDYACKVRDGVIPDPSFLPVIYEATPADDWTVPATWKKVNPNLGVSVSLEYLERECQRARETPAYENTFKRLHLNMKTEQDVRWLGIDKWDACAGAIKVAELGGRPCYAGLDLASTTDLAALVLLFPSDGEPIDYDVLPFFWIPTEGARRREHRDRVPYETWARDGLITATEGDVVDYDRIRARINELGQAYHVKEIAIDRWNSTQLATQLAGDGFEIFGFGQGFASMSAPTKELETLILGGRIRHGGHPVLRWNASNVSVETDAAGNVKPSKKKSTEKIDGIVALIMALGRAMVSPSVEVGMEFW